MRGPLGLWNRGTRRENQAGRDCNEFIEIKVENYSGYYS